jgi:hypothetical protein
MVVVEAGAAAESRARSEGKESRAQEKKGTGELIDISGSAPLLSI